MKNYKAIRLDQKGEIDDVAITCDMFRLEFMDDNCVWAAAYKGKKSTMFFVRWNTKKRRLEVTCYEDTIGCNDDTKKNPAKTK